MNQEQRERMTEIFAAVSDALRRAIVPVLSVALPAIPEYPRPFYLPESPPPSRVAARAQMDALIARGRRRQP